MLTCKRQFITLLAGILGIFVLVTGFFYFRSYYRYYPAKALHVPTKATTDHLTYDHIQLTNGLKVLLIHDPNAKTSAASLDVHIGSMWDPSKYPGLAHFLEHLLFMGTEKYPKDDEYTQFLQSHGGMFNAFTSLEHTNYFFSVNSDFFEATLDRFAQFFTSPLFSASCVEKEINAVNSEYLSYLLNDAWRFDMLTRSLGNPDHPYNRFIVGTNQTLVGRDGEDIRDVLIDFYKRHYSAELMRLVLYSNKPISTLISYANEKFSAVPKSTESVFLPWNATSPIHPENLSTIVWMNTIQSTRTVSLSWIIPDQVPFYKSKPAKFICRLIARNTPGSLAQYLKTKGWISFITAATEERVTGFSQFKIVFELTWKGLSQLEDVIHAIFAYLNLLKRFESLSHLFDEFAHLENQNFHYGDTPHPLSQVVESSRAMHYYTDKDVLAGPHVVEYFNSTAVSELLDKYLVPERVCISVLANHESMKCDPAKDPDCRHAKNLLVSFDRMEPWFGTEFTVKQMDRAFVDLLKTALVEENALQLPPPNPFIATDLSIHGKKTKEPQPPRELSRGMWFKQDDTFMLPKGAITLKIKSPDFDCLDRYWSTVIWTACLFEYLSKSLYPALEAGLVYSIWFDGSCISICVNGFSEKSLALTDRIVETVLDRLWHPDPQHFSVVKSSVINGLENVELSRPFILASQLLTSFLTDSYYQGIRSGVAQVEHMQLEDVYSREKIFHNNQQFYLEALVHGNYADADVSGFFKSLLNRFSGNGLIIKQDSPCYKKVVALPQGQFVALGKHVKDPNSCLCMYFQTGHTRDIQNTAMASLVAFILGSRAHGQLRTQEQLGYIVYATRQNYLHSMGIQLLVQSTMEPSFLYTRISAFLQQTFEHVAKEMTDGDLASQIVALQHTLVEPFNNLLEEHTRHSAALELGIDFEFRKKISTALLSISRPMLVEWMESHLINPTTRRMINAAIFGSGSKENLRSFAYKVTQDDASLALFDAEDDADINYWKAANNKYYM